MRASARLRRAYACHATKASAGTPSHQIDEIARVVDRGGRRAGEPLLVEPDRLEVERPGPPRRRGRVAVGQVVVVVVHLAGQVDQRLALVARRPGRGDPVALDERPRDVRRDVEPERDDEQADGHPGDRQPEQRARAQPAARGGGAGGGRSAAGSVGSGGGASGPKPARPASDERTVDHERQDDEGGRHVERRQDQRRLLAIWGSGT